MRFCKVLLSSCTADGELPVMRLPFLCILTLSTLLFSQNITATLIPIPRSENPASIARTPILRPINSSLGIPLLPDGFDLSYDIGGPKLRTTSCLMNAVATLKELALEDWNAKIIDGTEYKLDSYPEVSIIITTPKRKRNIRAGFVGLAICYGMWDMITKKKFEYAQFEISWNGELVGWVAVVNNPPSPGSRIEERQSLGTLNLRNKSAALPSANPLINITNVVTTENAGDPAEARLTVSFEPYGGTLGIYDVFVPIMSGLTDMAKIPNHYEAEGLMMSLQGFNGFICFLPALPLRKRPPVLTYEWLIRAVARIPTYMLSKGRFGEVAIKIAVDDVLIGFGRMSTKPDCDDDSLISGS